MAIVQHLPMRPIVSSIVAPLYYFVKEELKIIRRKS